MAGKLPEGGRVARGRGPDRRRQGLALAVAAVLAVLLVTGAWLLARGGGDPASEANQRSAELAGVSGRGRAVPPPWPVPADPAARARAAGLPMGPMGMAEHYHPQLRILVDGQPVRVPANLGVDPATGQMSGLHTHTPDGVIHIEAARVGQTFTLGQLFTEWDVRLARDQLGALRSGDGGTLTVTVDGEAYGGDPALLRLAPEQRITLAYRTGR